MKYIIDIPNVDVSRWVGVTPHGKKLYVPISVEDGNEYNIGTGIYVEEYTEPDRQDIEDEVWEFAWEVLQLDLPVFREIFGYDTDKMDYREYKSKYEEWKKQKDEIRVGDEVKTGDSTGIVYMVTDEKIYGVCNDTPCFIPFEWYISLSHKTGRHFDEVEALLKKMGG